MSTSPGELTEGFEEFVAIVQEGGISAAARSLGIPRATMSRRLSALEDQLGVRLAHRTTRTFHLTEAGEVLYARARKIVEDAQAARQEVSRLDNVPRGNLRVSTPPGPLLWYESFLTEFLDRYPEVTLEVLSTPRFVDLVEERIDVVVRAGDLNDSRLVGRPLFSTRIVCVASKAYAQTCELPRTLDELKAHPCILGFRGGSTAERTWPLRDGGEVEVWGRLATDDIMARNRALEAGHGLALMPQNIIRRQLMSGEFVTVLEEVLGADAQIWVLYVEREHLQPKVRAFVDHLVDWSKHHEFSS